MYRISCDRWILVVTITILARLVRQSSEKYSVSFTCKYKVTSLIVFLQCIKRYNCVPTLCVLCGCTQAAIYLMERKKGENTRRLVEQSIFNININVTCVYTMFLQTFKSSLCDFHWFFYGLIIKYNICGSEYGIQASVALSVSDFIFDILVYFLYFCTL